MQEVFPLLFVGDHRDAFIVLYTGIASSVDAVLDCTADLPTRKWNRQDLVLRKIGFAEDKAMSPAKLTKAIEFIHSQRKDAKKILVGCKHGLHRSVLVCMAYLCVQRMQSWEQVAERFKGLGFALEFPREQVDSVKKFVQKQQDKQKAATDKLASKYCAEMIANLRENVAEEKKREWPKELNTLDLV